MLSARGRIIIIISNVGILLSSPLLSSQAIHQSVTHVMSQDPGRTHRHQKGEAMRTDGWWSSPHQRRGSPFGWRPSSPCLGHGGFAAPELARRAVASQRRCSPRRAELELAGGLELVRSRAGHGARLWGAEFDFVVPIVEVVLIVTAKELAVQAVELIRGLSSCSPHRLGSSPGVSRNHQACIAGAQTNDSQPAKLILHHHQPFTVRDAVTKRKAESEDEGWDPAAERKAGICGWRVQQVPQGAEVPVPGVHRHEMRRDASQMA
nr:unnamed protein product [Digitaria exilis]